MNCIYEKYLDGKGSNAGSDAADLDTELDEIGDYLDIVCPQGGCLISPKIWFASPEMRICFFAG